MMASHVLAVGFARGPGRAAAFRRQASSGTEEVIVMLL